MRHIILKTMNKLDTHKRAQILSMLCEGSSMRSISRVLDVSYDAIDKLLKDAGTACADFHNEMVRELQSERVQCDEVWSFCYAKARNARTAKAPPPGAGDVWTWTAIDADSKLIVSWFVGNRDTQSGVSFMDDLRSRLANRVQLTTDGHPVYPQAVEESFGDAVDFAQLVKQYAAPSASREAARRYSPAECIGTKKITITGDPKRKHISTSFVERSNLSIRMGIRRFTRLTNAFSKRIDNHCHALALYFVFYNFCRSHKTLRMTPAMAAGVATSPMELTDIVTLIDAREPPAKKRGPYRPRQQKAI
jgi:IS1 family transposase